jgi:Domain of unknown function (DUF4132)
VKHHLSEWIKRLAPEVQTRFEDPLFRLERVFSTASEATPRALRETELRYVAWSSDAKHQTALAALECAFVCRDSHPDELGALCAVLKVVVKGQLPIQADELQRLLEFLSELPPIDPAIAPFGETVGQIERMFPGQPAPAEWQPLLEGIRQAVDKSTVKKTISIESLLARITQLCSDSVTARLKEDGGWADMLRQDVAGLEASVLQAWEELLSCASAVTPQGPAKDWDVNPNSIRFNLLEDPEGYRREFYRQFFARKASTRWAELMNEHVAAVGVDRFESQRLKWLQAVPESKPRTLVQFSVNREVLRGLLWTCEHTDDADVVRAMRIAAGFFFGKNSPLGRTCVRILAHVGAPNCLDELTHLLNEVKSQSQRESIEAARSLVAERTGVTAAELRDRPLSDSGFNAMGSRTERLSGFRAELAVTESGNVELRWYKPNGQPQKSVPAKVKRDHAAEFRNLKASVKEVKSTLAAARERLEFAPLEQLSWPLDKWRERYFDHPVAGTIGRRVIWKFEQDGEEVIAAFEGESLVDVEDRPVEAAPSARVSVWHPIDSPAAEVLAWREWLLAHEIRQPFKQAHREVYVLTDAERETEVYSNRFASHVLKQSQFRALAKSRGWKADYLGGWDGGYDGRASRELPDWDLRAEFWTDGASDEHAEGGGYLYICTDQVRFYRGDSREPLPLSDVPVVPFSEVMRDVDLFVGVCSLGNDPTWHDGRHAAYWETYSFGELSETARTRRAVLERIIPRLSIADRCTFSDRFLIVRGDIRTYRIHLGSSNILMEPNNEYLCIVSAQPGPDLFLPFEGDLRLSVILSKALLLADDTSITDRTITSQIRGSSAGR